MFKYAGITKSGLSVLAESVKNGGLEFMGAEYYDSIITEVKENINDEKKLKETIERLSIQQVGENLGTKRCSLKIQSVFKESNILKVVSIIENNSSFIEGFKVMSGALFVKSPISSQKVLFAYFVADEETASRVDPNISELNGDYFIATFNFKDLNDLNIKYTYCDNYSLPTIDLETVENEDGEVEGCNIKINYGLKKYVEDNNGEGHYESVEKNFIIKHGEKGDVGPEGPAFGITKKYTSIEEMYDDKENIEIGKHVIIEEYDEDYNIGEHNGEIYQRIDNELGYKFIVKIFGAKGEKGKDSSGNDLFESIYPVGSIYTSISPILPKEFSNDGREWVTLPSGYMLQQAYTGDLPAISGNKFTIDKYSENDTLKKIEEGIPDIFGEMLCVSKEWGSDGIGDGAFTKEASSNTIKVKTGTSETDVNVGSAKFFAHNGEYRLSGNNKDVMEFPFREEVDEFGEKIYGVYKPGYEHVQPNAIRVNMWLRIK